MPEITESRHVQLTAYFWLYLWRTRRPLFTLLARVRGLHAVLKAANDTRIAFRFPQFQEQSHPGFDRQVDESYGVVVIECKPEFRPLFFREHETDMTINESRLADLYETMQRVRKTQKET